MGLCLKLCTVGVLNVAVFKTVYRQGTDVAVFKNVYRQGNEWVCV